MPNVLRLGVLCLAGSTLAYIALLLSLTLDSVQQNLVYLNRLTLGKSAAAKTPELAGFAVGQISPFFIDTNDGEHVHAWHIYPSYCAAGLPGRGQNSCKISTDSKVVVYFHGNAGTMVTGHRPDTYRSLLSSGVSSVLAIDYRGYGLSSGVPSEQGLIEDGTSAVKWFLNQGVKPQNVAIVGQSLGAALAVAVAERLASNEQINVRLVMPIVGFSSMTELMNTYRIFKVFPVMGPLKRFPTLRKYLGQYIRHTWETAQRLEGLAKNHGTDIALLTTKYDDEISWTHTEMLFDAAVNASQLTKRRKAVDLGLEGSMESAGHVSKYILAYGGHNTIQKHSRIAIILTQSFR